MSVSVHEYVYEYVYERVYECECMHVCACGDRGQPWLLFLRCFLPCFLRPMHSFPHECWGSNSGLRLDWQAHNQQSHFLSLSRCFSPGVLIKGDAQAGP